MLPVTTKIDMGSEIHKCLDKIDRTVSWLADAIGHDQSNLNKQLHKPYVHLGLVFQISHALGIGLFACYSDELAKLNNNR